MAGACSVLDEEKCALVGGHSCEGQEMGLGFAVTGTAKESDLLRKGGMREGDMLILTKPVGTGVIFAAEMRGKAKGRWVKSALDSMQTSSRSASAVFKRFA